MHVHGRENQMIGAKNAVFRKFPKIPILAGTMCAWRLVKIVGGTMRGPHGTTFRPSLAVGDGAQSAGYGQKNRNSRNVRPRICKSAEYDPRLL